MKLCSRALLSMGFAVAQLATADVLTVTPATSNWTFRNNSVIGDAPHEFVTGPGTPPSGTGSVVLKTPFLGGTGMYTTDFSGRRLDGLLPISYWVNEVNPANSITIIFAFDVDFDLTDDDTAYHGALYYSPGSGYSDYQWHLIETTGAHWYFGSTSASGSDGRCTYDAPCTPGQLLTNWPNLGVRAGGGELSLVLGAQTSFAIATDALTIGGTLYDFEPLSGQGGEPCGGFSDVPADAGYCNAVAWVKARRITAGCTATEYCPEAPVSRAQMALFMNRLGTSLEGERHEIPEVIPDPIDLDQPTFMCRSETVPPSDHPRIAVVGVQFSGRTTGPADLAVNAFFSDTDGATQFPWKVAPMDAIVGNAGSNFANATLTGTVTLAAQAPYRFAIRTMRAGGSGDIEAGALCTLTVEIRSAP